ncbi:NAD(P)-dependent alcohol dehydrogenase [Sorangium cellulosum]|uniref:Alcohol dehydrogenase n=1 Tax=Sorangium cellulosum TaxID=56 RepID=A0A150Q0V9_SORCE|nr:NAD(P)-dependent alcohol dehydrogenase [Sorangium cellulosum]KYF61386.1 alcohol dehydrogenase [Sorangium cellulosum]
MKAIVQHEYGSADNLRLEEIPTPAPGDGGVLVRIEAAAVNAADWHKMRADPFFLRFAGFGLLAPRHRVPGADIAGRVEAVGKSVTRFRVGDEVFGDLSSHGWGGFAEYVCTSEEALAPKPSNVSFEEAAAVPMAAVTALQALRDCGRVRAGQRVLVNGASGGVGTFAVQIAKALGAEVTGVCSTANVDLVRSLGADHVVDYTRVDVTRSGHDYDVILDAAAYRSVSDYRRVLRDGGTYVLIGGTTGAFLRVALLGRWSGSRAMKLHAARPNAADLVALKELIEGGGVRPVIDRRYPLSGVPEAVRYVETLRARGKVVITRSTGVARPS